MEKLTYKQAFDKITEAYIKGEMRPMNAEFCFCGTLCDNHSNWGNYLKNNQVPNRLYTVKEFCSMEDALFQSFAESNVDPIYSHHPHYEDALFDAMCAALEVLKQIHKERGENVEDFQFEKRQTVK